MADPITDANASATTTPDPATNAGRTFTQEDVDRIVRERLARVKNQAPEDYDQLKQSAQELADLKEKSAASIQEATKRAEEAEAALASLKETQEHEAHIRETAATYGVSAEILSRMTGDAEENAKLLSAQPRYPQVDGGRGATPSSAAITREQIEAIKDPVERVRARAQHQDLYK